MLVVVPGPVCLCSAFGTAGCSIGGAPLRGENAFWVLEELQGNAGGALWTLSAELLKAGRGCESG